PRRGGSRPAPRPGPGPVGRRPPRYVQATVVLVLARPDRSDPNAPLGLVVHPRLQPVVEELRRAFDTDILKDGQLGAAFGLERPKVLEQGVVAIEQQVVIVAGFDPRPDYLESASDLYKATTVTGSRLLYHIDVL